MQYQLRSLCGFGRRNDWESREILEDAEITEHMTRNRPGNQQYLLLHLRVAMFDSPVLMRDLMLRQNCQAGCRWRYWHYGMRCALMHVPIGLCAWSTRCLTLAAHTTLSVLCIQNALLICHMHLARHSRFSDSTLIRCSPVLQHTFSKVGTTYPTLKYIRLFLLLQPALTCRRKKVH
jgi:hypothetical protein